MSDEIHILWRYSFRCWVTPIGWRERLGWRLRSLAERIDGSYSLAVRVESSPEISETTQRRCIQRGMVHAERLVGEEVQLTALEAAYRQCFPELHDKALPETDH